MGQSIFILGATIVVAAIVGGGLDARDITVPVIDSLARQIVLGVFGVLLMTVGLILYLRPSNDRSDSSRSEQPALDQRTPPALTPPPVNVIVNVPPLGGGVPDTQAAISLPPGQVTVSVTYTWGGRPSSLGNRFVGRDRELAAIDDAFTRGRAVVLAGGAGTGKSRLAAQYSHRAGQPGFWTAASATVEGTLIALAPQLGVVVEGREVGEVADEVSRALAGLGDEPLWVVDNLIDIALCRPLLEATASTRILFTTRDVRSEELLGSAKFVGVQPLDEDSSVQILRSAGYDGDGEDVLREIAVAVGHLPLALEMLAVRLRKATPRRQRGSRGSTRCTSGAG